MRGWSLGLIHRLILSPVLPGTQLRGKRRQGRQKFRIAANKTSCSAPTASVVFLRYFGKIGDPFDVSILFELLPGILRRSTPRQVVALW